jgi:hypothetical protein
MKAWLGIGVLTLLVGGIVAYKALVRSGATPAHTAPTPRVLLFADLREADDECPCGAIIRAVRASAARGIATRENDEALARAHRVTVEPTVLFVDPSGREISRYEGESAESLQRLRAALDKLTP